MATCTLSSGTAGSSGGNSGYQLAVGATSKTASGSWSVSPGYPYKITSVSVPWFGYTTGGNISKSGTVTVTIKSGSTSMGSLSGSVASTTFKSNTNVTGTVSCTGTVNLSSGGSYTIEVSCSGGLLTSGIRFTTNGKTLTVTYSARTYTVSYSANGHGSAPSSQTKTAGTTLTLQPFISTQYSAESSGTITGDKNGGTWSGSNGTAKWRTTYTQTNWSGGGSTYSSKGSYTKNEAVTLSATWSSSTAGTSYSLPTGTPTKANGTTNPLTVTFNANGGSTTKTSQTSSKTVSYSFSGWYTASSGGTKRTTSSRVTSAEIVYAQYTSSTGSQAAITCPTTAQCTRSGFSLRGWGTSSTATSTVCGPGGNYTPTSNITLYAIWDAQAFNLTFHLSDNENYQILPSSNDSSKNLLKNWKYFRLKQNNFLMQHGDGYFSNGQNGITTYAWTSSGATSSIRLIDKQSDNPFDESIHEVEVKCSTPSYQDDWNNVTAPGGWVQTTTSIASNQFIHLFVAKVPEGIQLAWAANNTGNNRSVTWLTNRMGTGKYEVYAYQLNCGSSGTFSTFGHIYIQTIDTSIQTIYIAYSEVFNITKNKTYSSVGYNSIISPPIPVKPGYKFLGWGAIGNGTNYIADYGRGMMYTNQISIHMKGYMDDWSQYATGQQMRLISCTEGGGWNIESSTQRLTNLTGTKWYLNSTVDISNNFTYNIDFYIIDTSLSYNDTHVSKMESSTTMIEFRTINGAHWFWYRNSSGWSRETARTWYITGGSAATDSNLINWLYNNATLQDGQQGYITSACYDSTKGYKNAVSNIYWHNLKSGWHDFCMVFNGFCVTLYLDNQLIGTSNQYETKKIGYRNNTTNHIYVGAEDNSAASTPTPYAFFNGKVTLPLILDSYEKINSDNIDFLMPAHAQEVYPMWEKYNHIKVAKPTSEIIDLTGTNWTINEDPELYSNFTYNINFKKENNNQNYFNFKVATINGYDYRPISYMSNYDTESEWWRRDNSSFITFNKNDLTSSRWYFNDIIALEQGVSKDWPINFKIADGTQYNKIHRGSNYLRYESENGDKIVYLNNVWKDENYKTIHIIGGTDVTNTELITYLQQNAIYIPIFDINGMVNNNSFDQIEFTKDNKIVTNFNNTRINTIWENNIWKLFPIQIISGGGISANIPLFEWLIANALCKIYTSFQALVYNNDIQYYEKYYQNSWEGNSRIITINNGSDVRNSNLINWLLNNATFNYGGETLDWFDVPVYTKKDDLWLPMPIKIIQNNSLINLQNLTDTLWQLGNIRWSWWNDAIYNINFISNNQQFSSFKINIRGKSSDPYCRIYYDDLLVFDNNINDGWDVISNEYAIIHILNGKDIKNGSLINFLYNYASSTLLSAPQYNWEQP